MGLFALHNHAVNCTTSPPLFPDLGGFQVEILIFIVFLVVAILYALLIIYYAIHDRRRKPSDVEVLTV
ncbi:hypothetical protein L596_019397 [Steinernema carpocapsae]|uniref:Uncharacterized protein n=1 Tax=Steinernema carpocapsae TaxID=34508 RepID=A0A4U5MQJ0_STECR|nr:hypothetical protein L596_019397 [Steinernema carpocapsae]